MKNQGKAVSGIIFFLMAAALSLQNASAADNVTTDPAPVFQNGNTLPKPNKDNDPAVKNFVDFYNQHVVKPLPGNLTAKDIIPFPSDKTDAVSRTWDYKVPEPGAPKPKNFATSNICAECHDGVVVKAGVQPNMTFVDSHKKLLANWSPYGEWRGTLMGLSGRDPVFQAQLETERIHNPVLASAVDNVCFKCHASMGQRQIDQDTQGKTPFSNCMMYATLAGDNRHPQECGDLSGVDYAKYGMQGRDGISCSMCHSIGPSNGNWKDDKGNFKWDVFYGAASAVIPTREDPPGPPYAFTSSFQYNMDKLYVPNEGIEKTQRPMKMSGLAEVERNPYIKESSLCGSCHVVIVPKVPVGYTGNPFTDPNVKLAYEQTTYLEWMNSSYGFNAQSGKDVQCQGCHMPGVHIASSAHPEKSDVVNLGQQWNVPVQPRQYARHAFTGSNLFTTEMFAQFNGILGITLGDKTVPPNTADTMVNAEEKYLETASGGVSNQVLPAVSLSIRKLVNDPKAKKLTAIVKVSNNTGHRFPSGVNLRRAFINFEVLDRDGKTLWGSGRTNPQGAIVDGAGEILKSEFTKIPKELQPNYKLIKRQDQVQIYELRNSDEKGVLTTQILRLFGDDKDNRLLPQGWKPKEQYKPGMMYLGLDMHTVADVTTPHEKDINESGSEVSYEVDLSQIKGRPVRVRVAMQYQATPPYYLADRFNDGEQPGIGRRGANTERLIYLASRLNTNLKLKNVSQSRPQFEVMKNWTMTIDNIEQQIK
jgi:hypothetical protein